MKFGPCYLSCCAVWSLVLAVALAGAPCRAQEFRVGALLNLTGPGARWGENARRGIELAQEQLNSAGGISGAPLRVFFEDARSGDLAACAAATQKLVNIDHVQVILSQWTGDTEIAWSIASRSNVPVISVSAGAPDLTRGRPLLLSMWGEDTALLEEIVKSLETMRFTRMALLVTQDPYFLSLAASLRRMLEARGISLVLEREVPPDSTQFRSEALRVKLQQADCVFSFLYLSQQADLVKQLRALQVSPDVFGVVGSDDESFFALAGDAANGVLVPTYATASDQFAELYLKRWGQLPWLAADTAYDSIQLLASVNQQGKMSGPTMLATIRSLKGINGASGPISFTESGVRVARATSMLRLKFAK